MTDTRPRMRQAWVYSMVAGLVAGGSAAAEDITVTTYYPSPRGVYNELRTLGDVGVGTAGPAVGARLRVTQDDPAEPSLRVDTVTVPGQPALVVAPNGNVGIRNSNPVVPLHVFGEVNASAFRAFETNGAYGFVERGLDNDGIVFLGGFNSAVANFTNTWIDGNPLILQQRSGGNIGIRTTNATNPLTLGADGVAALPALAFGVGDENTGIYHPGSDVLALTTDGAERLRVTPTGRIGIGHTDPQRRLHVAGGIVVENGLLPSCGGPPSDRGVTFDEHCHDTGLYSTSNGFLTLLVDSGRAVDIVPGGSVGIGTSAPGARLHVSGGDILVTGGSFVDDGTVLNVPDFVFAPGYDLVPLPDVEAYVQAHRHLEGLPAADDAEGWRSLSLQAREMRLLQKIEELTLYLIHQERRLRALEARLGPAVPAPNPEGAP